ncbi:MAG: lytic transglycosylase domain-containing protein [Elusimicrobia bacterium]|nr:lytic transglycosylase domain-containing protein [Elusimicrobiota bacterium]
MRVNLYRLIIACIIAVIVFVLLIGLEFPVTVIWPALHGPTIESHAAMFNIDPLLITALIKAESNFFRHAHSHRGAIGLMQLMPSTARELAAELNINRFTDADLELPDINIRLGTYYFAKLIKQCNGNTVLALASYNAGFATVHGWYQQNPLIIWEISDIPYRETRNYVKNIIRTYTWLKQIQKLKRLIHHEIH